MPKLGTASPPSKKKLRELLARRTTDTSRARLLARYPTLKPEDRPRSFQTTRGKRRLSYEEAYNRRTTDTSRARAMKLYGKTEAPPSTNRSFQPVPSGSTAPQNKTTQIPNPQAPIKGPSAPHRDRRVTVTYSGRPAALRRLLPAHLRNAPRARRNSRKKLF